MAAAYLPVWRVAASAAFIGVPLSVVSAVGLGHLVPQMAIAMARAMAQLSILGGLVLAPLMRSSSPTLVFLYVAAMVAVAGQEAASKLAWQ